MKSTDFSSYMEVGQNECMYNLNVIISQITI